MLHQAGFTPNELAPGADDSLLAHRLGITNLVGRASAKASELSSEELRAGGALLEEKALRYLPRAVAILGISAFRVAFSLPRAEVGRQVTTLGRSSLWVLPNPSGLQARYQLPEMVKLFSELREGVEVAAPLA